jgi:hypothetical protein
MAIDERNRVGGWLLYLCNDQRERERGWEDAPERGKRVRAHVSFWKPV